MAPMKEEVIMTLDRKSNLPLYMQLKSAIIGMIGSGELKPGSIMPTEYELCSRYGISRYPVRQAMEELVNEGYLNRTRGKGTFVSNELPEGTPGGGKKLLGLILGNLTDGFSGHILSGFEKQARKCGYLTVSCCSEGSSEEEWECIDRLIAAGADGIAVFPCDDSRIAERMDTLRRKGIYLGLLDRNPGLTGIDYVGSDNAGGAYTAVRHLSMQGYRNVAFVSDSSNASSVYERLEGYLKAVEDFGLHSITHINIDEDLRRYPYSGYRFLLSQLKDELTELVKNMPLGIFAVNDGIALQCMRILQAEGIGVGREVGIVGFDNMLECEFAPVPLTSIAQNGLFIGKTAADSAINQIEGKAGSIYRTIVPTQLVVRESCGEKIHGMK